jgi:hypothetical protein
MEATARIWGMDQETRDSVLVLAQNKNDVEFLKSSPSQRDLKSHLGPVTAHAGIQGYSIYSTDGIIISSTLESDMGKRASSAVIIEQLNLAVKSDGKSLVSLPFKVNGQDQPVMMASFPIPGESGIPVAILFLLIDPESEFTEILQRGRMGESGESYAFNKNGKMISESRFTEDLKSLALVPESGYSILTIDIRDPGGNLLEGYRSNRQMDQQPLTLMA